MVHFEHRPKNLETQRTPRRCAGWLPTK